MHFDDNWDNFSSINKENEKQKETFQKSQNEIIELEFECKFSWLHF
jgi:hypothetical protein